MRSGCGFVYAGVLNEEGLRDLLASLKDPVGFAWNLSELRPWEGSPSELRDAGLGFDGEAEVRWRRRPEGDFLVQVTSDRPFPAQGLEAVEGEWGWQEVEIRLMPLSEARISPPFDRYPGTGKDRGVLLARVFFRNGVPTWISHRRVQDEDTASR